MGAGGEGADFCAGVGFVSLGVGQLQGLVGFPVGRKADVNSSPVRMDLHLLCPQGEGPWLCKDVGELGPLLLYLV